MKPTAITPGGKVLNPVVRWTPFQTPAKTRLKNTPSSAKVTPRSLLNTPVQSQTPTLNSLINTSYTKYAHQQPLAKNQLINKTSISAAQALSRKLIQKNVKLLNAPKLKPSDKVPAGVAPTVKLFPSTDTPTNTDSESLYIPQQKAPIAPVPKLPPQQALYLKKILLILIQN